jgi:hypothetical protein
MDPVRCTLEVPGMIFTVRGASADDARRLVDAARDLPLVHVTWDGPHETIDVATAFDIIMQEDDRPIAVGDCVYYRDHAETGTVVGPNHVFAAHAAVLFGTTPRCCALAELARVGGDR